MNTSQAVRTTNAQVGIPGSRGEATYGTLLIQPVAIEIGIMAIQKTVSHPLTGCMNTGFPSTEDHRDFTNTESTP